MNEIKMNFSYPMLIIQKKEFEYKDDETYKHKYEYSKKTFENIDDFFKYIKKHQSVLCIYSYQIDNYKDNKISDYGQYALNGIGVFKSLNDCWLWYLKAETIESKKVSRENYSVMIGNKNQIFQTKDKKGIIVIRYTVDVSKKEKKHIYTDYYTVIRILKCKRLKWRKYSSLVCEFNNKLEQDSRLLNFQVMEMIIQKSSENWKKKYGKKNPLKR